jgi:hypothetical protein
MGLVCRALFLLVKKAQGRLLVVFRQCRQPSPSHSRSHDLWLELKDQLESQFVRHQNSTYSTRSWPQTTLSSGSIILHYPFLSTLSCLRYLGYTIYANQGYISTSRGWPLYILRPLCITRPAQFSRPRTSHSPLMLDSLLLERRNFRRIIKIRVIARDRTCVMTGSSNVEAPHAKRHQMRSEFSCIVPSAHFPAKYMINLASHRREPSVDRLERQQRYTERNPACGTTAQCIWGPLK